LVDDKLTNLTNEIEKVINDFDFETVINSTVLNTHTESILTALEELPDKLQLDQDQLTALDEKMMSFWREATNADLIEEYMQEVQKFMDSVRPQNFDTGLLEDLGGKVLQQVEEARKIKMLNVALLEEIVKQG